MTTTLTRELDLEWQQFLNNADVALNPMTTGSSASASASKKTKSKTKCLTLMNQDDIDDADDHDADDHNSDIACVVDDAVLKLTETTRPKCTPIYISTKTKISYLTRPIEIQEVFWKIPILKYAIPKEGIIKKQMKFSTTDPAELAAIQSMLKQEVACVNEFVIEHIENPDGRIKFKDQRKISIGLCKKDIVSYRIKQKRAFFNCFVVILRIVDEDDERRNFKEMHVKVFNTGKLEIPGVKTDVMLHKVQKLLVQILRPAVGDDLDFQRDQCETVLINSNFKCGYYINRDALYQLLKYKYRINCNYDACSYPGIQCKFFYVQGSGEQNGQQPMHSADDAATMTNKHKKARNDTKAHYEISFMIFRTGSVLIVGKCNEDVLHEIYNFIRTMLETEYMTIGKCLVSTDASLEKKRVPKVRRKVLLFSDGAHQIHSSPVP
jgi:TATA-box binding protein (TBP) (component of TFIID and TFIIIB)